MVRGRTKPLQVAIITSVAALGATGAFAQNSPVSGNLALSTTLSADTNPGLVAASPGSEFDVTEALTFSFQTETSTQLLEVFGGAALSFMKNENLTAVSMACVAGAGALLLFGILFILLKPKELKDLSLGYGFYLYLLGVLSALLDTAMAHCLLHQEIEAVTGELNVRYLEQVDCDGTLNIRAWVDSSLPPLYHLRSHIRIGDKRIFIPRSATSEFFTKVRSLGDYLGR